MKLNSIQNTSDLQRKIHETQVSNEFIQKKKILIRKKNIYTFGLNRIGIFRFNRRICVLNDVEIKKIIFEETRKSKLRIHPNT